MPSLLATLVLLPLVRMVNAEPSISFPFNAQLPLAARVDEFYSYSFSQDTFRSDSKITYTFGEHPSWLSIESSGRRLYGTPKDGDISGGDVVGQKVEIIATDDNGSTTMGSTLVVSRDKAPQVKIPLDDQISNFGNFSAPSSILSYPSTEFKFSFDQNTFGRQGLNYYAVSGNSSPLPAWVLFDASSMTFTGKTPPFESLVQPPQTFDLRIVASDIVGFSAASLDFSIVVGSHKITTDNPIITLNATRGSKVSYNGLENGVKLDGKQVAAGDLSATTKDMPKWLSYDTSTWKLQGTPGDNDHATNFTITFKDRFSDALDVLVVVNVATGLFKSTFEDLKVRPGEEFDMDLAKYFKDPNDINVKVSTDPSEDWLKVSGLKLSGKVPKTAKGSFKLLVEASSKSSDLSEKEAVNVNFLALDGTTTTATASTKTTTATATSTKTNSTFADETDVGPGHLSTGEILLATIIPVIFVAILIMLLVCYFRRRRAGRSYLGSRYRNKISPPVASSLRINGSDPSMREAAAVGAFVQTEKMYKPGKPGAAFFNPEGNSPLSSHRRSSETLAGLSSSDMPHSVMVNAARTTTIRSICNVPSEDGRHSWVTIDAAGAARSVRSSHSQRSETTLPESMHQIFPGSDLNTSGANGDFRNGLDFTLPTLDELPSLQTTPLVAYHPEVPPPLSRGSIGGRSAATTSSAALPTTGDSNLNFNSGAVANLAAGSTTGRLEHDPSVPNWVTLAESEAAESISELRKPEAARVNRRPGDRPWYEVDSADGSKSFTTDVSFDSTENWRVIGNLSPTKTNRSYKDLVDEAPFHPSRPGTARDGARPGERGEPRLERAVTPVEWVDEDVHSPPPAAASGRLVPSASIISKLSSRASEGSGVKMSGGRGHSLEDDWLRDHSGKLSEGSYKVFL